VASWDFFILPTIYTVATATVPVARIKERMDIVFIKFFSI